MNKLTNHQQETMDEALVHLMKYKTVLIEGEPGTGKTYCSNELLYMLERSLQTKDILRARCTAPTNDATAVLEGKIDDREGVEFSTTHSALKYKCSVNYTTRVMTCKPSFQKGEEPLQGLDALLIDEVSMVDKEMLSYIVEYTERFGVYLIMLGDRKQLPPIGERVSRVFEMYKHCTVNLIEVVRQGKGNPIHKLRKNPELLRTGVADLVENPDGGMMGYAFESDREKLIQLLAKADPSKIKYLAFQNKTVNAVNEAVRKEKYGKPDKYEIGETLLFSKPYREGEYSTNQEIKVRTLVVEDRVFIKGRAFKCYVINEDILVLYKRQTKAFNDFRKTLTPKQSYQLSDKFAQLKYTHAVTVHRSQGKTFEIVVIDVGDIDSTFDRSLREKLIYTADSRPTRLVIVTNW